MRRILTLLAGLLITGMVFAEHVSKMEALKKAEALMPGKKFEMEKFSTPSDGKATEEPFYIFNVENGGGYVLVSGNDQTTAILGYSTNGNIDLDNIPDNLRYWLESYAAQLKAIDEGAPVASRAASDSEVRTRSAHTNIAPLLTTKWNQSEPYNLMCPDGNFKDYNASGYNANNRCVTGCVATALAQVMYYHKWPQGQTTAIPQYTINYSNAPTLSLNELPATTFEWNKMKPSYSETETGDAADAVAKLMRYVGQACQMAYGTRASNAYIHTDMMISAFGYSKNIHTKDRDGYTTTQWENMVYDELASGRPVLYSGQTASKDDNTSSKSGHQFVCDGYKDGLFSLNWGWGGSLDGYFVLSIADPNGKQGIGGSSKAYKFDQSATFNFMPATPDEEEIPVMTSAINTNFTPTEYIRATASEDFTIASLPGRYSYYYNKEPISSFYAEIGWGLYEGEQLKKCFVTSTEELKHSDEGYTNNNLTDAALGAGLADGRYQLRQIFRKAGSSDNWTLMDNCGISYYVAEISGNTLTIRIADTQESFRVNSLTISEEPAVGMDLDVTLNITNTNEAVLENIRLWTAQKGSSNWTQVVYQRAYIDPYESGDVNIKFQPATSGTFTLKVTTGASEDALATQDFTVANVVKVSYNGMIISCIPTYGKAVLISGGTDNSMTSLTIPPSITVNGTECIVTTIADGAFRNWYMISSLDIPEGVEHIGDGAFPYCYNLKKLVLPSTLKSIGDGAFYGERALSEVISHIQDPFAISENTFTGFDSSTGNGIPSDATLFVPIGTKDAYIANGWTDFKAIEEGEVKEATIDGLKYSYSTGSKKATVIAGDNYSSITNLDIPTKITIDNVDYAVKSIGADAFWNCNGFSTLILPRGLESIGNEAFGCCFGLTKIELPSSLKNVGSGAFSGEKSLTEVFSHILEPFDISDDTFSGYDFSTWTPIPSTAKLYVPKGTKSKYENCAGWKTIFQGRMEEADFANGDANGSGEPTESDAVDTISYLLGQTPDNFDAAAVDMNGDGLVTVTDIILLMIAYSLIP